MNESFKQSLAQKVFILATGHIANQDNLASLKGLIGDGGETIALQNLVNNYTASVAASRGVSATVRDVMFNGTGFVLSDADVSAVSAKIEQGQVTWAELYAYCINLSGDHGQTLTNRAAVANEFVDELASEGKGQLLNGAAINEAVKILLGGVSHDPVSVVRGQVALDALAGNLTDQGIEVQVGEGYREGTFIFADANNDLKFSVGEWGTQVRADGACTISAGALGSKLVVASSAAGDGAKPLLTAPMGATEITPLTTLIQSLLDAGDVANIAQAEKVVREKYKILQEGHLLSEGTFETLASAQGEAQAKAWKTAAEVKIQDAMSPTQASNDAVGDGVKKYEVRPSDGGPPKNFEGAPAQAQVINISLEKVNFMTPAKYDASAGSFIFFAQTDLPSNAQITGFGPDDSIVFSGNLSSFDFRGFEPDLRLTARQYDTTTLIMLVGIGGSDVSTVDAFNARTDIGNIFFA